MKDLMGIFLPFFLADSYGAYRDSSMKNFSLKSDPGGTRAKLKMDCNFEKRRGVVIDFVLEKEAGDWRIVSMDTVDAADTAQP